MMHLNTSYTSHSIRDRFRVLSTVRHAAAASVALTLSILSGCDSSDDSAGTQEQSVARAGTGAPTGGAKGSDDAAKGNDKSLSSVLVTPSGSLQGELAEDAEANGKQVLIFRGVPYAQPPTGDRRWKAPAPVEAWKTPRDATQWGNRCPQGESTLSSPGPMSEDCLNLNVLTPATKASERLPVMVFFHGGGLSVGTGNSPTYCHTALPAQGVVVVTVNSRLGAFGYFSHPALAKESDEKASGNYGTLDLIESLRWVQKNIGAFGGDAENVTIFGESGGGSKVLSCMASPLAKGLFHRAIIESGSRSSAPMATTPRENAEAAGKRVVAKLGVAEDDDTATQLRSKSWEDVLAASAAMDVMFTPNLSVDGWVLTQPVDEAFAQGKQSNVPLIVGANEGEVGELKSSIPALAASMASVTSKAYVYNFTHLPAGWREPGCYAFHGLELPYVFGHMAGVPGDTIIYLGSRASCNPMKEPMVSDEDELVAKHTMSIWTQFAKTGDPSVPGLIEWPAYTAENDSYLAIGAELEVKMGVATSGKVPGS